jgi:hypothetical protein
MRAGRAANIDAARAFSLRAKPVLFVISKLGRVLLIVALLTSCGAHWLVLQSVAWTTMLVENSRRGSLVEAVKTTFDGAHPCGLCKTIETERGHEQRHDPPPLLGKIEIFHEQAPILMHPPRASREMVAPPLFGLTRSTEPALRPPRIS